MQSRSSPKSSSELGTGYAGRGSRSSRTPAPRWAARDSHLEHPRIGHAYHFVDLERGVRRNGKLIVGDIQRHIDTIRTIAQQEHLRETCLERLEKAERVVPKMQATIEFVSGYVRQQVRQLDLPQLQSYAMHAQLIPSYYLERVASTRTVTQGEPLRALAERLRTPLFEPGGALSG